MYGLLKIRWKRRFRSLQIRLHGGLCQEKPQYWVCVGKKGNGQVWVTYLNINPAEIYSGTRGISTSTLPDPWQRIPTNRTDLNNQGGLALGAFEGIKFDFFGSHQSGP